MSGMKLSVRTGAQAYGVWLAFDPDMRWPYALFKTVTDDSGT